MSTQAHILAIGKFGKNIADCLDYTVEMYGGVAQDSIITTELFHCYTKQPSEDLAEMFDVDQWNFNTYYKSNHFVGLDVNLSDSFCDDYGLSYRDDVESFSKLKDAGFDFIYMLST